MIEPRHPYKAKGADKAEFIGGTPDVDMWFRPDVNVLIVLIGPDVDEWGAYYLVDGKLANTDDRDENDAAPKVQRLATEKKNEWEEYIALFAPWIVEQTQVRHSYGDL